MPDPQHPTLKRLTLNVYTLDVKAQGLAGQNMVSLRLETAHLSLWAMAISIWVHVC
jgi:hypothetical protein